MGGRAAIMSAMANERVKALRAEARRQEKNLTNKASRLRHGAAPVEISGTRFDVRKGGQAIGKMRSRDLEVHIARLAEVNKRTSRFIQTEEGVAGPEVANRLFKARNQLNRQRRQKLDQYGGVKTHTGAETIEQRWATIEPKQRFMSDPVVNNPFREVADGKIKYRTPEAVLKMAENYEKRASPEFQDEEREAHRRTLNKMLSKVYMPELEALVSGMTDEQFDLMWYNPDFMAGEAFIYEQVTSSDRNEMTVDEVEAMDERIFNETEEAVAIAKHAILSAMGR